MDWANRSEVTGRVQIVSSICEVVFGRGVENRVSLARVTILVSLVQWKMLSNYISAFTNKCAVIAVVIVGLTLPV